MTGFSARRQWWVVVAIAVIIGVAAVIIADLWLPDWQSFGGFIFFGLVGVSFCWVYSLDRERLWWAIIPGLGALSFFGAGLADIWYGTDPGNDWLSVLVLGVGAALIGALLQRIDAKRVLVIVAMFIFIVGVAMAPLGTTLTIILIVAMVLAAAAVLWFGPGFPALG